MMMMMMMMMMMTMRQLIDLFFRCGLASLYEGLPVRSSVRPSVRPYVRPYVRQSVHYHLSETAKNDDFSLRDASYYSPGLVSF